MKHYLNILKYSLFLSLVIAMVSCGGDDDGEPTDTTLSDAAETLTQGEADVSTAKLDGSNKNSDWDGFTIEFSGNENGGTYKTNATGDQQLVWPTSGDWEFKGGKTAFITRDGDTDMALELGNKDVTLSFSIDTSSGRTLEVDGEWVFGFDF